jgi:ubiquinone/menaquinone biosynthesis C-methylase UbiE
MPGREEAPPGGSGPLFRSETQKRLWAGKAEAYDRWADPQAETAERFNAPLLEAAGVAEGQSVLDLAAGAGEPALSAARRVGARGQVIAADLSPAMLAGARRRAQRDGRDNLRLVAADMMALPFPDGRFDAVTCRFGLMFVPEPVRSLAEARRVLRHSGRAAFLVWGPLADNTLSTAMIQALDRVLGPAAGDLERMPFRFSLPGRLTALMGEAGFAEARETELRSERRLPVGESFWAATMEKCLGQQWRDADDALRGALDAAIRDGLAGCRDGSQYRLTNHVRIGVGRRA